MKKQYGKLLKCWKRKKSKIRRYRSTTPGEPPATPVSQERRSVDEAALDNQSQDIQKAVKEGATIEEAISEKYRKVPKKTSGSYHLWSAYFQG
ncbi:MAG: hypothetical protein IPL63_10735 [Saprospiraceae bacterium]|nr:hypothetical protein [Saprospiraceae bacterium]